MAELRRFAIAAAILFTLVAIAAAPAHAVDGVIEINQAKVMASGGFPFSITEGGSYRLTSNLVVAAGGQANPENLNAIEVSPGSNPKDVDIDLNGFTIQGPVTCTFPVTLTCSSNASGTGEGILNITAFLSVHDGSIVGFAHDGIDSSTTPGARLSNLHLKWNQRGAYVIQATVENIVADQNRFQGLNALYSTIRQVTAVQNNGNGIFIQYSSLDGCHADLNAGSGVNDAASSVIRNCALISNSLYGLNCSSGQKCGYAGNRFEGNVSGTASNGIQIGLNICNGVDTTCP